MSEERMKSEKLQDAIGLIDDEYIEKAHEASGKTAVSRKKIWMRYAAAAACVMFVLSGSLAIIIPAMKADKNTSDEAGKISHGGGSAMEVPGGGESGMPEVHTSASGGEGVHHGPYYSSADIGAAPASTPGTKDDGEVVVTEPIIEPEPGEAFVLTGGVWNDNDNWPFFLNLVGGNRISFPSYGLDPRNRIKVTVTGGSGEPLEGEKVGLLSADGNEIWATETNRNGVAYLFYDANTKIGNITLNGKDAGAPVSAINEPGTDTSQGGELNPGAEVFLAAEPTAKAKSGVQVMFILDTTGSMSDEIAYLQKDFMSIAEATAGDGVSYSINFYRDEGDDYVTRCNGFTTNAADIQRLLGDEYATGGGDTPEAVAQILTETITENSEWRSDARKIAFLIFDAPPHDGTDEAITAAIKAAAEKGIKLVPVVASNADRETELFGRAAAIMTGADYVFLTDHSGVGDSHLEPIIGDYTVELLHDIIVREINNLK